jgi:hypothetical protein
MLDILMISSPSVFLLGSGIEIRELKFEAVALELGEESSADII